MSRLRMLLAPSLMVLLSFSFAASAAEKPEKGPQISLSLDGTGEALFIPHHADPSYGYGGSAFLDLRLLRPLSLGVGAEYLGFFGSPSFKWSAFDLGGRIFPLTLPSGEVYLQGGVGLDLIRERPHWGHYHGYAGVGYRHFLGPNLALDLGAQYDFLSPIEYATNGVGVKLGITFLLGRTRWPINTPGASPAVSEPQNPLPNPGSDYIPGSPFYTWKRGDTLRDVSAKAFGEDDLFAALVDSNRKLFAHPARLREGVRLRVPTLKVSDEELSVLRFKSTKERRYLRLEAYTERIHYTPVKHWKGPRRYVLKVGDDLKSVASKLYGDEDLYPILVDANKKRLIHPANLRPGDTLVVPPPPTKNWVDFIHERSWDKAYYIWWQNVSTDQ
jgi:hypothetical protein